MRIYGWLKELADRRGSDLYLATGAPACAKFDGALTPISAETLAPGEVGNIANELMDAENLAEGVEDKDTYDWLKTLGCEVCQGYFVSRPLDASAFKKWIIDFKEY